MKQTISTALVAVTQPPPEDENGSQNEESGEPKTGKTIVDYDQSLKRVSNSLGVRIFVFP
jgi:hypothetical protein